MKKIEIDSTAELKEVAHRILSNLNGRHIVLLKGGMGAGKTTLVSAIVQSAASSDSVTSPTFAIVNEYLTPSHGTIFHFDMYRIENINEALDFGVEEYLSSGNLCLIEWPEKIEALLPDDVMTVSIEAPSPNKRIFKID